MNSYIIVEKDTSKVLSLLELDGDYYMNSSTKFSVRLANKITLDFSAFTYTIDMSTGIIAKNPIQVETPISAITPMEVTIE